MSDRAEIHFTLPPTISALGLLAMPSNMRHLREGVNYGDDSLVHAPDGRVLGRWFIRVGDTRLWEPNLANPTKIETLRWRVISAQRTRIHPAYDAAFTAAIAIGRGRVSYQRRDGTWGAYHVEEGGLSLWGIDKETTVENTTLGNAFHHAWNRLVQYNGFLAAVSAVLEESIRKGLSTDKAKASQMVKVSLNGRIYWMQWIQESWGLRLARLAWPGDDVAEVSL